MLRYIVMEANAKMPASVKARYKRVAVIELDTEWMTENPGQKPKMISERARGVNRIMAQWERLHVGQTEKGAYQKALHQAELTAAELNSKDISPMLKLGTEILQEKGGA